MLHVPKLERITIGIPYSFRKDVEKKTSSPQPRSQPKKVKYVSFEAPIRGVGDLRGVGNLRGVGDLFFVMVLYPEK